MTRHRFKSTLDRWSKASIRGLSELLVARGCPVCDRPTPQVASHIFCIDCQRQLSHSQLSHSRDSQRAPEDNRLPVIALGNYSGTLKRAILAMKYGDRPEVARPLGLALGKQWRTQRPAIPGASPPHKTIYAVPIPLHAERQRSRGFNQAELIGHDFCRASRLPLLADGLIRVQATQPQHELGLAQRKTNLSDAFQLGPSLQAHSFRSAVLLIDDIYTTGTTAESAAATLRRQGISVVGIAVVAQARL